MTDTHAVDPTQRVAPSGDESSSASTWSANKAGMPRQSASERSRARQSVANAARSAAARMRSTATRLDVLAERLSSAAGQQMGGTAESEFVSAGRRATGPRQG